MAWVVVPVTSPQEGSLNQVHLHFSSPSDKATIIRVLVLYGRETVWDSKAIKVKKTERFGAYTEVGIGNRGIGVAFEVEFSDKESQIDLESVGITFVGS